MTGRILGFETATNSGVISGDDGKRYNFTKQNWKERHAPWKNTKVDFDIDENGKALDIYQVKDTVAASNDMIMGVVSLVMTFFLGFIGTFISRLILSKQPFEKTIIPTLLHFIVTVVALIPILGWIIYIIATIYYMVKNYKLVMEEPKQASKYA